MGLSNDSKYKMSTNLLLIGCTEFKIRDQNVMLIELLEKVSIHPRLSFFVILNSNLSRNPTETMYLK